MDGPRRGDVKERTFPRMISKSDGFDQDRRWRAGSGRSPMLKVVQDEAETNAHAPAAVGESLLDEIVRDGARQMLRRRCKPRSPPM